MKKTFRLDSILNVVLVVFGQHCLSLRAIMSIIDGGNRILHGSFGKLKRLSSTPSIFNSNGREIFLITAPRKLKPVIKLTILIDYSLHGAGSTLSRRPKKPLTSVPHAAYWFSLNA